ncbi:hypothetical protein M6C35_002002 [Vibrio metschnikovii]|nr:hypothetical protein [Vibrio metschnikovii]
MSVMIFDTTQHAEESLYTLHEKVIQQFAFVVSEFRTLIEADSLQVLFIPVSFGKDSTLTALAALEAYKQCIEAGTIESARPLIMSTGDPMAEAIPMKMYTHYAVPRLLKYAKQFGINLYHDFVMPTFYEEFANRYFTAQKFIPNVTRSGDCSVILKVVPSERYLKSLLNRFEANPSMSQYANATVICATGQRNKEGSRRQTNMKAQGTSSKDIHQLVGELNNAEISTRYSLFLYAPIRDWTTEDVFTALELAGDKPLTRNLLGLRNPIPGFMSDFSLLLAIYGNASNEACEIAVGSKQSAGCNGKSRYGCLICPMVGTTDKTQTALSTLPRWQALLQEEALRVRDYMFRLSTCNEARMMHAKAFDPVGYSRIALQSNVLKVKYLEKLVRYSAQLSIESSRRASQFAELVANGDIDSHPGIQDIKTDVTLNAKARRAFLEMYIEQAQKPLITLFSERHAVYLSFRWSLDGIKSLPYRPLAIWNELTNGRGWVPYPQTNSEYELVHGKIQLQDATNPLPEAVMMTVFNESQLSAEKYVEDYQHLMQYWTRPFDASDMLVDSNCSVHTIATKNAAIDIIADITFSFATLAEPKGVGHSLTVNVSGHGLVDFEISLDSATLKKVLVEGAVASRALSEEIEHDHFQHVVEATFSRWIDEVCETVHHHEFESTDSASEWIKNALLSAFPPQSCKLSMVIPFMTQARYTESYQPNARQVSPALSFTKRVTKVKNSQFFKGNTRLSFYPLDAEPRLHYAHADNKTLFATHFGTESQKIIDTNAFPITPDASLGESFNIMVTQETILHWKETGGFSAAISFHNQSLKQNIRKIRQGSRALSVRHFPVCAVAESMLTLGAVTISNKYLSMYKTLSKRTQLFEEIGAFDYQEATPAELQALSFMVPMQQHRADKAKVLTVVRRMRNERREFIRVQLTNPLEAMTARTMQFFEQAQFNVSCYLNATLNHVYKAAFETGNVSFAQQACTAKTWLNLYQEALTDPNFLVKTILSGHQLTKLNSDIELRRQFHECLSNELKRLASSTQQSLMQWNGMKDGVVNLEVKYNDRLVKHVPNVVEYDQFGDFQAFLAMKNGTLHVQTCQVRDDIHQDYTQSVQLNHPRHGLMFEPTVASWKPNLRQMADEISHMKRTAIIIHQRLTDLSNQWLTMSKTGLRQSVANMTLSQRLSAIGATESLEISTIQAQPTEIRPKAANRTTKTANQNKVSLLDFLAHQKNNKRIEARHEL